MKDLKNFKAPKQPSVLPQVALASVMVVIGYALTVILFAIF